MGRQTEQEPESGIDRGSVIRVGAHTVSVEDGTIHHRYVGDVSKDEMVEMVRLAEQLLEREGAVFTLNDIRAIGHISPEARRYATDWMRNHRFDGAAIYGANLVTRTVVTLLLRAINLLRPMPFESIFCGTEQEARAWISERRQRLQRGPSR
jgi:hypothetical protein